MFQRILKTMLLIGMKVNSYSAITSNQICMYISKIKYKNHIPCGRRQLTEQLDSIKNIFKIEHVVKLFSVLLRINLLNKTEIYQYSFIFYICFCSLGELQIDFPLVMHTLRFLKSSESTGKHDYIPGVCTFKEDIRRP